MKTIVLDDDPTGTQSATDAWVALQVDADLITELLGTADGIFIQTNSRSLPEDEAVAFVRRVREQSLLAGERLGESIRFVLRGDSTLRGHVFSETDAIATEQAVMLFVPAFPAGGRTTQNGIHLVRTGGADVPAAETEYAADPIFPFHSSALVDYVAEKSNRPATAVALQDVRSGSLVDVLLTAAPRTVVVPDAVTDHDIELIALAVEDAGRRGADIVIRCAAPLAARLAGVASTGLLPERLAEAPSRVLVVCGSHTTGARAQLDQLDPSGTRRIEIDTELALREPNEAGHQAAELALALLRDEGVVVLTSERERKAEHNTLWHGAQVMNALVTAVAILAPHATAVLTKGGITSARVATEGLGATRARVLGQALPGIPVWQLIDRTGRDLHYVIVPGNVGEPNTLRTLVDRLGATTTRYQEVS